MDAAKIIGIFLIVAGGLALGYRGFTYTKETHDADIGNLHLSLDEKEHVSIPTWAGAAALIAGVLILVVPRKS